MLACCPSTSCSVRISALALLKMAMHAKSGGNIEVMGVMQGKVREGLLAPASSPAAPRHLWLCCCGAVGSRPRLLLQGRSAGQHSPHHRVKPPAFTFPPTRTCWALACSDFRPLPAEAEPALLTRCTALRTLRLLHPNGSPRPAPPRAGQVLGDTFVVMDAFALPVEGTETRVNAQAEAYEYMVDFLETNKVGGPTVGGAANETNKAGGRRPARRAGRDQQGVRVGRGQQGGRALVGGVGSATHKTRTVGMHWQEALQMR